MQWKREAGQHMEQEAKQFAEEYAEEYTKEHTEEHCLKHWEQTRNKHSPNWRYNLQSLLIVFACTSKYPSCNYSTLLNTIKTKRDFISLASSIMYFHYNNTISSADLPVIAREICVTERELILSG